MYKNSELECVPNYKYLGIYFTAFGTFSLAKNELYKKALKAFFKLRNLLEKRRKLQCHLHTSSNLAVGNVTGQNQYSSVNMMGDH
jgi:hypothetical protein